jgi:hypothetical protein
VPLVPGDEARRILAVALTATMGACGGPGCRSLPEDYPTLPLQEQIGVYREYLANHFGAPSRYARRHISLRGYDAANAMAAIITGADGGFPVSEAVEIVALVQQRGCTLKGTAAEHALIQLQDSAQTDKATLFLVRLTLDAIARDVSVPGGPDRHGPGACPTAHEPPGATPTPGHETDNTGIKRTEEE